VETEGNNTFEVIIQYDTGDIDTYQLSFIKEVTEQQDKETDLTNQDTIIESSSVSGESSSSFNHWLMFGLTEEKAAKKKVSSPIPCSGKIEKFSYLG
jgi:hypothetical protein